MIFLASVKHIVNPIKKELLLFIFIFVLSFLIEVLLVNVSKAWSYTSSYYLNVPVWAPLFWGFIGIIALTFYKRYFKD